MDPLLPLVIGAPIVGYLAGRRGRQRHLVEVLGVGLDAAFGEVWSLRSAHDLQADLLGRRLGAWRLRRRRRSGRSAWCRSSYRHEVPGLAGEPVTDGLAAALWAVTQHRSVAELLALLSDIATPSVLAAAGSVLGLRDGVDALPATLHARRPETAARCIDLVPGLLLARTSKPVPRLMAGVR